jgi:ribosomal protein S18
MRACIVTSCLLLVCPAVLASMAEKPIEGGLGIAFGESMQANQLGAELKSMPDVVKSTSDPLPDFEPGAYFPWRYFRDLRLPRLLRDHENVGYLMINEEGLAMRMIARIDLKGCNEPFEWMKRTLMKKYAVSTDVLQKADAPFEQALSIDYSDKRIRVRCGPYFVIDYADRGMIQRWTGYQAKIYEAYERGLRQTDQRRLVLEQRRAAKFADLFTLGTPFRLDGAFGIEFGSPFAKNSKQKFPADVPFVAVLPNLPAEFANGEIQLIIDPQKHPILIRGRFSDVDFDKVVDALKAKYGTPMKASERHVIHKVSGNHAIVKRLENDMVELAFVDTDAQSKQRVRLWERESEGL